jgi:CRP/FNR family transcriptional regulator
VREPRVCATTDFTPESSAGNLWLFQDLSEKESRSLGEASRRRCYEPGDAIFIQGDPAVRMYFIESGLVRLVETGRHGIERLVDIRGSGGLLVLNFLSPDAHYPVSALCVERTVLHEFTREGLERLVVSNPHIGLQMMRNMGERICWLTDRAKDSSVTFLEDRLLKVLTDLAREHGRRAQMGWSLALPLTHRELGMLVGAHRVSVSRALKSLRDSGLIAQEGSTLLIPDRPGGSS